MRIYGFFNSVREFGDAPGHAIDENGNVLATHVSSCDSWAASDLAAKRDVYDKAHPNGWVFEFVRFSDRDTHIGLQAALNANKSGEPHA